MAKMEIAVISDSHLHSLSPAFAGRIETIAAEVDHFFHLGDAVCTEVLDFLSGFSLTAVSGNMDPGQVKAAWPMKRTVSLEGYRFGLVHGWGAPHGLAQKAAAEFKDVDCVCFGHTHRPFAETIGGVLVFNPGSATQGRGMGQTYGRLTLTEEGIAHRHLPF